MRMCNWLQVIKRWFTRYIKEFVHGDMGRCQPSLGDLFACDANIVQLDVLDVACDGL